MMGAATTVFGQGQDALNVIWKVEPTRSGAWSLLRTRLVSLSLILGLGLLLLLSLVINALLAGFSEYLNAIVPFLGTILQVVNSLVSFGVLTALFGDGTLVVQHAEEHTSELQSLMRTLYAAF